MVTGQMSKSEVSPHTNTITFSVFSDFSIKNMTLTALEKGRINESRLILFWNVNTQGVEL